MRTILFGVATLLALISCQSAPPSIPEGAPSAIYFQKAQAASDEGQYAEALGIYEQFLKVVPDATREDSFSARYEIGVLYGKLEKYSLAIQMFQGLVDDYADLDKSSGAPNWIKVLAEKKLQTLTAASSKAQG